MIQGNAVSRTLVHFPIIHTQTDLGKLKASIRRLMLKKSGLLAVKRKVESVNRLWTEIERAIDTMGLDFQKVRLYQDALPVCGREERIVKDLARKGSRNHRLLIDLMERGATLMGTESAQLLLEEYEAIKREVDGNQTATVGSGADTESKRSARRLLSDRDRFIAQRISDTLMPKETGILFLGLLHHPETYLAADIRITHPIHQPVGMNHL